jgi:hypothetical protein
MAINIGSYHWSVVMAIIMAEAQRELCNALRLLLVIIDEVCSCH